MFQGTVKENTEFTSLLYLCEKKMETADKFISSRRREFSHQIFFVSEQNEWGFRSVLFFPFHRNPNPNPHYTG